MYMTLLCLTVISNDVEIFSVDMYNNYYSKSNCHTIVLAIVNVTLVIQLRMLIQSVGQNLDIFLFTNSGVHKFNVKLISTKLNTPSQSSYYTFLSLLPLLHPLTILVSLRITAIPHHLTLPLLSTLHYLTTSPLFTTLSCRCPPSLITASSSPNSPNPFSQLPLPSVNLHFCPLLALLLNPPPPPIPNTLLHPITTLSRFSLPSPSFHFPFLSLLLSHHSHPSPLPLPHSHHASLSFHYPSQLIPLFHPVPSLLTPPFLSLSLDDPSTIPFLSHIRFSPYALHFSLPLNFSNTFPSLSISFSPPLNLKLLPIRPFFRLID